MPFGSAFICTTFVSSSTLFIVWLDALGEDVDEIAIGARQQTRRHLDDGDGAAERGVDRCRARGRCSRRRRRAATSGCRADRAPRSSPSRADRRPSASAESPAASRSRGSRARTARCSSPPAVSFTVRCVRVDDLGAGPGGTAPCDASRAGRCRSVSRLTTLSLKSRSFARSIFGSPNSTPHAFAWRDSSISLATCSSAFDGMQPR